MTGVMSIQPRPQVLWVGATAILDRQPRDPGDEVDENIMGI